MDDLTKAYMLLPYAVSQDHIVLWVAYFGRDATGNSSDGNLPQPRGLGVRVTGQDLDAPIEIDIPDHTWAKWLSRRPETKDVLHWGEDRFGLWHTRATVDLQASATATNNRPTYSFELFLHAGSSHQWGNRATARRLPAQVPTKEDPFRALLGSCYSEEDDPDRKVAKAYENYVYQAEAQGQRRPDIKILTGDQVYLDKGEANRTVYQKGDIFFKDYLRTWKALLPMLRHGGNFFSADDHEFWNDYPKDYEERWAAVANELFDIFQTVLRPAQSARPVLERQYCQTFSIGDGTPDNPSLSFFKTETRAQRTLDGDEPGQFMRDQDLQDLKSWISDLTGPGVIVLAQPIFELPDASAIGEFGLADFTDQYHGLCERIWESDHSIVVFTGDLHFGRLAWTHLSSGAKLFEVMSSPMTVSQPFGDMGGKRKGATFLPHHPRTDFRTRSEFGGTSDPAKADLDRDHFMIVDFRQTTADEKAKHGTQYSIRMDVTAHFVDNNDERYIGYYFLV